MLHFLLKYFDRENSLIYILMDHYTRCQQKVQPYLFFSDSSCLKPSPAIVLKLFLLSVDHRPQEGIGIKDFKLQRFKITVDCKINKSNEDRTGKRRSSGSNGCSKYLYTSCVFPVCSSFRLLAFLGLSMPNNRITVFEYYYQQYTFPGEL